MNRLYASPLRVYLLLGALALVGLYSAYRLPVSLFPNSAKPQIWLSIPYGNMTAEEFLNNHGKEIESRLRAIRTSGLEVEDINATYGSRQVSLDIEFHWGGEPTEALKEVQNVINAYSSRLQEESRDRISLWLSNENSGFFALSFFSETRDLDALYDLLEPVIGPRVSRVRDAQDPVLWNPSSKEVRIELIPETMAALQLVPRDIDSALAGALGTRTGGSITLGTQQLSVEMPRRVKSVDDLKQVPVLTPSGRAVHLGDIARIDVALKTRDNRSFKTNGAPSLILFATPRPGGNVKQMSEELLAAVKEIMPQLPKDVQYRVLVDPSEFIRSAVNNVFHEVAIAAMLAVMVLFVFIGSFRNVATAAIEIPLSMVLAFILMRLSGMNLNLISLGGLALSAGMNVDASVVVMENIFRHFEKRPGPHDFSTRLAIVVDAVREVRFAVIASTIASLVVFLPLIFTSGLSYAILGDLALAVVFSHGFSAFVALLLVPTVRLHLMSRGDDVGHAHSPIERQLGWLERKYGELLGKFIASPQAKRLAFAAISLVLVALATLVLPRLPKEIVGRPDTDWMILSINTQGNTLLKQMESTAEQIERDLLKEFGDKIRYTFTQVRGPNNGTVMARLNDKRQMRDVWKAMEKRFANTPLLHFWVGPWNPSELPIPNPPDLRVTVRGGSLEDRAAAAKDFSDLLQEKKVFPRVKAEPHADLTYAVRLAPHTEQWAALIEGGNRFTPGDLADIVRVATLGRQAGYFPLKDRLTEIILQYPPDTVSTIEDIGSIPIGVGGKIVPLRALAEVNREPAAPDTYRESERELFVIEAREQAEEKAAKKAESVERAKTLLADFTTKLTPSVPGTAAPTITMEDASDELTTAIRQLTTAIAISVFLIFLTMLFQFGSVAESILVLAAIPLGFIGVLLSLFVFGSTLSLNSMLGVILLNGIAVANSILLVDFIDRNVKAGLAPREAAVLAARQRLRPILITSLTTVLGMLPVALGTGEGGRILQPLGIAVSGGLWVSMGLTLFVVPALQVAYLEWRARREAGATGRWRALLAGLRWRRTATATLLIAGLFGLNAVATETAPEPPARSFRDALHTIVERHTSVGVERATLGAVEGQTLSTRLGLLPSVSLFARQRMDGLSGTSVTKRGFGVTADLNLLRFGADIAGMRAASQEIDAQSARVTATVIQAEDEGALRLLALIQAELERDIQRQIVQMWQDSLAIGRERYRRGLTPAEEADKLSVDLDNAQAALRDAEAEVVKARADVEALLGDSRVELRWPWEEVLMTGAQRLADQTTADLSGRPDWVAGEHRFQAARYRAKQAFGLMLPSLDATGTFGYFETRSPGPTTGGTEWSGMLTLTIPLFDRLAGYGGYQAASQRTTAAEWEWEKVKRTARAEWDTARSALRIALDTVKARARTLTTARKLYEANLRRFRQGIASANELLIDQERRYRAELYAVRGWSTAHRHLAQACHALGKRLGECLNGL